MRDHGQGDDEASQGLVARLRRWLTRWRRPTSFALPPSSALPTQPFQPSAAAPDTVVPASPRVAADEPMPAQVGRFRAVRPLGHGSMGVVYLAHDPLQDRQIALKVLALSTDFEGEALADARERFLREAETAGRLRHPHIVEILEAGQAPEGAYIAMELLTGRDLVPYTRPGQLLPMRTVVSLGARLAHALAYAHARGIVHRDVKPANVVYDPARDIVKLTDFGIARLTDVSRTRTGIVLGTPSFMSPEQLAGRKVDGRSDLYSLGVMLFQLLTGQLPHRADTLADLMHRIVHEPAPDPRALRPEIPRALADVVLLALQKRPETRYASADTLAADLAGLAAAWRGDASPAPAARAGMPPAAGAPDEQATVLLPPRDRGASPPRPECNDTGHNADTDSSSAGPASPR